MEGRNYLNRTESWGVLVSRNVRGGILADSKGTYISQKQHVKRTATHITQSIRLVAVRLKMLLLV